MTQIRRQGGFTLLEVIIASAIFALIGVGAFSMLNSAQTAQDRIEDGTDRLFQLQRAMRIIASDVGQMTARVVRDEFGDMQPSLSGQSDRGGLDTFMAFTKAGWRNPIGLPRSSLQNLRYQLEEQQLIRYHWTYVDKASGAEPFRRVLLEGVEELDIKFLHQGNWINAWPINQSAQGPDNNNVAETSIPRAVLVSLTLDDFGEVRRIIRVGG